MRRLNTGPIKVEGDWPGIFIRGDEALGLASTLEHCTLILDREGLTLASGALRPMVELLRSCHANKCDPQVVALVENHSSKCRK